MVIRGRTQCIGGKEYIRGCKQKGICDISEVSDTAQVTQVLWRNRYGGGGWVDAVETAVFAFICSQTQDERGRQFD